MTVHSVFDRRVFNELCCSVQSSFAAWSTVLLAFVFPITQARTYIGSSALWLPASLKYTVQLRTRLTHNSRCSCAAQTPCNVSFKVMPTEADQNSKAI